MQADNYLAVHQQFFSSNQLGFQSFTRSSRPSRLKSCGLKGDRNGRGDRNAVVEIPLVENGKVFHDQEMGENGRCCSSILCPKGRTLCLLLDFVTFVKGRMFFPETALKDPD